MKLWKSQWSGELLSQKVRMDELECEKAFVEWSLESAAG